MWSKLAVTEFSRYLVHTGLEWLNTCFLPIQGFQVGSQITFWHCELVAVRSLPPVSFVPDDKTHKTGGQCHNQRTAHPAGTHCHDRALSCKLNIHYSKKRTNVQFHAESTERKKKIAHLCCWGLEEVKGTLMFQTFVFPALFPQLSVFCNYVLIPRIRPNVV